MAIPDEVIVQLERELRLMEADYQCTLQAEPSRTAINRCSHSHEEMVDDFDDQSEDDCGNNGEGYSLLGTFDGSENDDNGDSDSDTNGLASLHADAAAGIFVGLSSGDERRAHDRSTVSTTPAFAAAETAAGPTSEMQGRLPVARARYAAEVKMSAEDAESIRAAMSSLDLPAPEWAKELDNATLLQHVGSLLDQFQH